MNEDLVSTVTTARFTRVLVREGYEMSVVDEFLARLVERLTAGDPVGPMIEGAQFQGANWQETYDRLEVDLLLSMVKHKAQTRDPDAPVEAEPPAAPEALAPVHVPGPRLETVVEKKGLLARLFSSQ